jgi:hypothetical protein
MTLIVGIPIFLSSKALRAISKLGGLLLLASLHCDSDRFEPQLKLYSL